MASATSRPHARWAFSSFALIFALGLAGCSSSDNNRSSTPQIIGTTSSSSSSSTSTSSGDIPTVPVNPVGLEDADGNPVSLNINVVNPTLEPAGATAIHLHFVNKDGDPVDTVGTNWQASSRCLTGGKAEVSAPTTTASQVSFNYTTLGCLGEDQIIFTTPDFESTSFSTTVTIEDTVSYISWVASEPSSIAIAGSGGPQKATVVFRLNGTYGDSVAGERVSFDLEGLAGDTIRLIDHIAISDSEGYVRATVMAGSMPNVVTVVARHEASGTEAASGGLVVATGLPSDGHFHIALQKDTVDTWDLIVDGPATKVVAAVTDRVGNPVVDGTVINFVSPDAGSITKSCTTVNNTCSVEWKPDGRVPTNGRAHIMATVKGTENFIDRNGNNIFDGEDDFPTAFDLGEPYIDHNNSGDHEPGEYFVDANRNGVRDEGDGLWNGLNCQHSSLCSDTVQYVDLSAQATITGPE